MELAGSENHHKPHDIEPRFNDYSIWKKHIHNSQSEQTQTNLHLVAEFGKLEFRLTSVAGGRTLRVGNVLNWVWKILQVSGFDIQILQVSGFTDRLKLLSHLDFTENWFETQQPNAFQSVYRINVNQRSQTQSLQTPTESMLMVTQSLRFFDETSSAPIRA